MLKTENARVVVVGAGPAGLVLAWLLHQAGIPVVLIEQQARETLARQPKAGLIEHRTVESLYREGLGGRVLSFDTTNTRCEFRTTTASVQVDYASLTGGRPHYVYPQHELVERLCTALLQSDGRVLFEHTVDSVRPGLHGVELTVTGPEKAQREVTAEFVVGCDGAGSAIADAVTAAADGARTHERTHAGRWLVLAADAPPLVGHTIYAAHPRGFAGHMRRGHDETRYYLEIPATDTTTDWPQDRIRDELSARLTTQLDHVPFAQVDTLNLRMRVHTPMQHGRVFLAGDAAHLITPAGGKGMNLAIGDAIELAHGLIELLGQQDSAGARLASYSTTRLPTIWQAQAFSDWFLRVLSASYGAAMPQTPDPDSFANGLRRAWVSALQDDPHFARWFAHAYAGADPKWPPPPDP